MKSEKEDGNGERSIVNSKMIKEVQEQELERKKDQEPVCRQGRHEQESGRKIRQKDPPKRWRTGVGQEGRYVLVISYAKDL